MAKGWPERLSALGYVAGQNSVLEFRFPEGRPERLPPLAANLVASGVDIIVAQVSSVAHVAKKTTETVPIVVLSIVEPGGRGLVASLNRPGGNITGFLYDGEAEITGKRIQLLKDIVPKLKTLAILGNPDAAGFKAYIDIYDGIGRALGVRLQLAPVRRARSSGVRGRIL